ncbi:leucine-rich repeat domain-containing protein, partial [Treponema sp. R80B11-R83G3]
YGLNAGTLTVRGVGPVYTFNSVAEFSTWLNAQSANTEFEPYTVKLNVGDLGGEAVTAGSVGSVLNANSGKYVNLDLSGSTITSVPDLAFCITNVVYDQGWEYTYYIGCDTLVGITLPDSLISIGERALSGCHGLTVISISDSVKTIGDSAISNCTGLQSVTIGSGVTNFGYGAFWYCPNLTSVTIRNGVTVIGILAFKNCYSLTSVSIPDSVTSIEGGAFDDCRNLVSVSIPDSVTRVRTPLLPITL